MKAMNFKLATISFAALLLASCSDNGTDNPANPITPITNSKLLGISVKSNTDAKELSARVTNYKVTSTKVTRASFSNVFGNFNSMPAESSITPTGKELPGDITDAAQAGTYIVSSYKEMQLGKVGNTTIYVMKGATLKLTNVYELQNNVTIYVMSGATLIDPTYDLASAGITIYNYGTLQFTNNSKRIAPNQYIYNYGDANWANSTIVNQGYLYVGGDFKAKAWDGWNGKGGTLYVSGSFEYPNEDLTFDGNNYIGGKLTAKNITFINSAKLYNECGVFATQEIKITGNNELHVAYLKAQKLEQSSNSNIYLKNNSFIETPNYVNHNAGVGSITLEGDNAVAYIIGEKLHYNQGDGNKNDLKMFRTSGNQSKIYFNGVFCEEWNDNRVETTLNNDANVFEVTTENQKDFTIKKDACNPGYNDNGDPTPTPGPDPTPEPKPDLDLITTIEYPNHTHDISATCVKEYNNKMYLSYHTRGAGHGACLEVFSPVTNNQVTMVQYLQDTENMIDFNHLIVDGKTTTPRVLTVGSHFKKGAMTATIDIKNDGLLNTESTEITENQETKTIEPMQMINLIPATAENAKLGYDENCIVRDGDKYVVATTGYMVYDTNFNEIKMTQTDGRVKHLSLNNGKIASLTFDRKLTETENENTAIPAHINIYPAGTTDFSVTPEHSFAVAAITPNNGKNTIALVGDRVYACLGGAGFYCYDLDGNVKWHYQIKNALNTQGDKAGLYKATANGCFIGGKYIYVAYGSAGLKVLDMDGKLVAERYKKIKKGNYSANYVTVYNGYIYVAHGKNRLQVYRLYNCDADTDVSYNE